MEVKETKDHYVAQTYLRRFHDDNKELYVYDKDKRGYFSKTPKAICFERGWDLMKGSGDILWLKKILENIEHKLSSAMTRLVDAKSTLEDRVVISRYLAILQILNPGNLKK